jgi:hypothetical protein
MLISVCLLTACEDELEYIVGYSGDWKIVLCNESDTPINSADIAVEDDGSFCSMLKQPIDGGIVYIRGKADYNGTTTGGFGSTCTSQSTGTLNGTFTELMGGSFASGTFQYTASQITVTGKWYARRD